MKLKLICIAGMFWSTGVLCYSGEDGRTHVHPAKDAPIRLQGLIGPGMGHVPVRDHSGGELYSVGSAASRSVLPARVDLSASMPPVGNQGTQGSCAAWTCAYAIKSYLERIDEGLDISNRNNTFSPAYVYNQTKGFQLNTKTGTTEATGTNYIVNFGLIYRRGAALMGGPNGMPYNEYDYTTWPTQEQCASALKYRGATFSNDKWFFEISKNDLPTIQTVLSNGIPIYLAIGIDGRFHDKHGGDTTNFVWYPYYKIEGYHAITVIGYDNTVTDGYGNVGALLIQNSWGTNWWKGGYAWISYAALSTPYVNAIAFCADRSKFKSTIQAKFKVDHPARGTVAVSVGVGSTTTPDKQFTFYDFTRDYVISYGDPFTANIQSEIDLTDFQAYWPPTANRKWWIKVSDKYPDGKSGTITEFSLIKDTTTIATSTPLPVTVSDNGTSAFAFVETSGTQELPVVSVDATASSVKESSTTSGTFTVTRSGSTSAAMAVNFTVSGTATKTTDYTDIGISVTIPVGAQSASINVRPVNDTAAEDNEIIVLMLAIGNGYKIGAPGSATVTITDDDGASLVIIRAEVQNASEMGPTAGNFVLTRAGGSTAALTIDFTVSGTAISGADYVAIGTSVVFTAGATQSSITVIPITDVVTDDGETVIVKLASGSGYTVGSESSATITINDAALVRPANDNFASRTNISSATAIVSGSNVNATKESGEPLHAGAEGGVSVWWSWTAQSTGQVTISTAGSGFDTTLAVYTGTSLSSLTQVDSNDDTGHFLSSQVTIDVTSGTSYSIAVDGSLSDDTGTIVLAIGETFPEISITASDKFASEIGPEKGTILIVSSVASATPLTINIDVDGTATNGADYTAIGITATIAANATSTTIDIIPLSDSQTEDDETVTITLESGSGYNVSTNQPSTADVMIREVATTRPANDDFANATKITGSTYKESTSTLYATRESDEPDHVEAGGVASLWWKFTASSSGTLAISTKGSSFDSVLAVYTGASLATLEEIASNDDLKDTDPTSTVIIRGVLGTTYFIVVDGFDGDAGPVTFSLDLLGTPIVTIEATTSLAQEANSVPGIFTFRRLGSATGDLTVNFYVDGKAINGTDYEPIGESIVIPAGSDSVTLSIKPVDDKEGEGFEYAHIGLIESLGYLLSTNLTSDDYVEIADDDAQPPANDNFAASFLLTALLPTITTGTNVAATYEDVEPFHAGNEGGPSVWWSWTPLSTSQVTFSTTGSDFDTLLGIYTGANLTDLIEVASNDDENGDAYIYTSSVTFMATAGSVYRIAVDGYDGDEGNVSLTITTSTLPIVTVLPVESTASESAHTPGKARISRTGNLAASLTATFALAGSAENGVDYEKITGTSAIIPAGSAYVDILIKAKQDIVLEGNETVTFTLQDSGGYMVGKPNSASIVLVDDEITTTRFASTSPISATPNPALVNQPVQFTSSMNSPNADVAWDLGDGTTGNGATTTHAYSASGLYKVNMAASLNGGVTSSLLEKTSMDLIVAGTLHVDKATLKKSLNRSFADSFSLRGSFLLPASASDSGGGSLDFGGYQYTFGTGKSAVKVRKSSSSFKSFTINLRSINLGAFLDDEGLQTASSVKVKVQLTYAGAIFAREVTLYLKKSKSAITGRY